MHQVFAHRPVVAFASRCFVLKSHRDVNYLAVRTIGLDVKREAVVCLERATGKINGNRLVSVHSIVGVGSAASGTHSVRVVIEYDSAVAGVDYFFSQHSAGFGFSFERMTAVDRYRQ